MHPNEAQAFLSGASNLKSSKWKDWPLLESKQQRRFLVLTKVQEYRATLSALKTYIERCIPAPQETEIKFWSVTNLLGKPNFLRVNVGQQEVFTIHDEGNTLFARPLAKKPLSEDIEGPLYATRSFANFVPIDDFDKWLNREKVIQCRELVVWLMRHTVPINSGSHCPQLVRAAFGPNPSPC